MEHMSSWPMMAMLIYWMETKIPQTGTQKLS